MRIAINPTDPDQDVIGRAAEMLRRDGVLVYPTDTVYGIGCRIGSPVAIAAVYRAKGRQRRKPASFICRDLQQISRYAVLSDGVYRLAKQLLPGPYTLVLPASSACPKPIQSAHRAVGVRIPDCAITAALVEALGEPLISTSANISGEETPADPAAIEQSFGARVNLVLDAGPLHGEPSTVLDCTGPEAVVIRQGAGPWPPLTAGSSGVY
jgi:tRNA threonylcarbamoyl adenosine modification protein (Sua5/YciO/YrdC/YwlC family)